MGADDKTDLGVQSNRNSTFSSLDDHLFRILVWMSQSVSKFETISDDSKSSPHFNHSANYMQTLFSMLYISNES